MGGKVKIPAALWVVFVLVDVVIVGAVLAAVFWVAPVPPAFVGARTLAQAQTARADGVTVAVVTADSCLACQMYKRGALADERVTAWMAQNASAVYLKWGKDQRDIAAVHATGYPTTVVLAGGSVLASHTGGMSAEELLAFLEGAAARVRGAGAEGSPGEREGDDAGG